MIFKLLTAIAVVALLWQMLELWKLGRKLTIFHDPHLLARHRATVASIGCLALVAIALIELQVRLSPNPYAAVSPWLFGFHLLVDATLVLVGAVIVLRYTGLRDPWWHRRLAYTIYVLLFISAVTGSWMLYKLPT
jgi:hypothetical protein